MLKNPQSLQYTISNINLGTIDNNEEQTIREAFLQHPFIRPWSKSISFIISEINIDSAKIKLTEKLVNIKHDTSTDDTLDRWHSFFLPPDYTFNISFSPLEVNINWVLNHFKAWYENNRIITFNVMSLPKQYNNKYYFMISNFNSLIHQNLQIPEQITINYQNYYFDDVDSTTLHHYPHLNSSQYLAKLTFSQPHDSDYSFIINVNNIDIPLNIGFLPNNLTLTIINKLITLLPKYEETIRTMFNSHHFSVQQNSFIDGATFWIKYLTINNQWISLHPLHVQFWLTSIYLPNIPNLVTHLQQIPNIKFNTIINRIRELNPQLDLEYGVNAFFIHSDLSLNQDPGDWYRNCVAALNNGNNTMLVFQVSLQFLPAYGSNYSGIQEFTFTLPADAKITPFDIVSTIELSTVNLITELGILDNNNYETIIAAIQRLNPDFSLTNLDFSSMSKKAIILQARPFNNLYYNGLEQRYSGKKRFTFTLL